MVGVELECADVGFAMMSKRTFASGHASRERLYDVTRRMGG